MATSHPIFAENPRAGLWGRHQDSAVQRTYMAAEEVEEGKGSVCIQEFHSPSLTHSVIIY